MVDTPLSQTDVLEQLTTRGFEEGFVSTTLRDFWGTLTNVGGVMREGDRGSYLVVLYDFAANDLEVIESTVPYTSPIGQIEITHSNKAKSKMGYFGVSVDKIINAGVRPDAPMEEVKKQGFLLGKRIHMRFTPGHLIPRKTGDTWDDIPTSCWELIEVGGEGAAPVAAGVAQQTPAATGVSATQQALSLLDGKTEQQWHQVVFNDPIVKVNTDVVNSIIGKTFLTALEAAGTVMKDGEGIYHVKTE